MERTPMRFRRLFRFSLRTFLVATTIAAIWFSFYLRSVQKQKQAVAGILEFGGSVYYDFQIGAGSFNGFDLNAEPTTPNWLVDCFGVDWFHNVVAVDLEIRQQDGRRSVNTNTSEDATPQLAHLSELRSLKVGYRQATSHSMSDLSQARKLEFLYIAGAPIGDRGVAALRNLTRLRCVTIYDAGLTDESMKTFAALPNLKSLTLGGDNTFSNEALRRIGKQTGLVELKLSGKHHTINDEGLKYLSAMNKLKSLGLQGAQISDAGLHDLSDLPQLSNLEVGHTQVTWKGVDQWKKSLDHSVQFNGGGLTR